MSKTKKEIIFQLIQGDLDKLKDKRYQDKNNWGYHPLVIDDMDVLLEKIKTTKNANIPYSLIMRYNAINPGFKLSPIKVLFLSLENGRDLYHSIKPYAVSTIHVFYNNEIYRKPHLDWKLVDAALFISAPLKLFKMVADYMDKDKPIAYDHDNSPIYPFEFALFKGKVSHAFALMEKSFSTNISEKLQKECVMSFFGVCVDLVKNEKRLTHPWRQVAKVLKNQCPDIYNKELSLFNNYCIEENIKNNKAPFSLNDFLNGNTTKKIKNKKTTSIVNYSSSGNLMEDLMAALRFNQIKKADLLFDRLNKNDLNQISSQLFEPFIFPFYNIKAINFLLKKGLNINVDVKDGYLESKVPLFFRVLSKDLSMTVHYAQSPELDLSEKDILRMPMNKNSKKVFSSLLSKVDINKKDKEGRNVLDYIIVQNKNITIDVLDLLYKKGFDFTSLKPESKDIMGKFFESYHYQVLNYYQNLSMKDKLKKEVRSNMVRKVKPKIF